MSELIDRIIPLLLVAKMMESRGGVESVKLELPSDVTGLLRDVANRYDRLYELISEYRDVLERLRGAEWISVVEKRVRYVDVGVVRVYVVPALVEASATVGDAVITVEAVEQGGGGA